MNNKTLLIFGILLGSFITLFFVIYYNYTYNYENFYDKNITDDNDNTNGPNYFEDLTDSNDSTNGPNYFDILKNDWKDPQKDLPSTGGRQVAPTESQQKEQQENAEIASLSLNDSNDASVSINECYSLFELKDDNSSSTYDNYPLKENILMQISTEKETNIDNASNKWYDNFNYDFKSSNHDNNKFWFIISNNITKLTNNKYAMGALLKDIQLTGPSSMQFANNNNTLNLNKFTIVLTTKINSMDIGEKYCLFKMALQKDVDHTTQNDNTLSYGGHIALILTKKNCNNIALNIYFADKEFYWTNIPLNILQKNIIISLSYLHNDGVSVLIDNLHKNFSFDILNDYKLGSTPLIINENGKHYIILHIIIKN